jgi:5-methylcytosine-specific restriction endonuclease McrA
LSELKKQSSFQTGQWAYVHHNAKKLVEKEKRERVCQNCGYDKHVQICHIKPIKNFEETATLSEVNASDNLVVLCPNCHWEFDHGLLKLKHP